ncbi:hypothetical protein CO179_00005, partial [candidate division WWE3 bacterium CG_4_9_14_3_um_filter_39_7]
KHGWSPELIAGRWRKKTGLNIQPESIYKWNLCKNTRLIHGVNNSSVFRKFVGDEVKNLLFS